MILILLLTLTNFQSVQLEEHGANLGKTVPAGRPADALHNCTAIPGVCVSAVYVRDRRLFLALVSKKLPEYYHTSFLIEVNFQKKSSSSRRGESYLVPRLRMEHVAFHLCLHLVVW